MNYVQASACPPAPLRSGHNEILERLRHTSILYRIHEHAPSVTIQDADQNLWFPVDQLLKTIAFRIKNRGWVLAALCGYSQVDYKKLAAAVGVSRDKLMRLSPTEVALELGYELGGVAPFAFNDQTRVVIDAGALTFPVIYCGVGRKDRTLEISPADLLRVTGGEAVALSKSVDS